MNQFIFVDRLSQLYNLLEDKLSKDLFWARLQCDCGVTFENLDRLISFKNTKLEGKIEASWSELIGKIKQLNKDGKKVFLYGAKMTGKDIGRMILNESDFFGYCARNSEKYEDGVMGKPVYSPEYLFEHSKECYVMVSAIKCIDEIYEILAQNHFPADHILSAPFWNEEVRDVLQQQQYFEFPALFPKGKAFVDAGCYDCATSKRFVQWCGGDYSKIFAFEPDLENFSQCQIISEASDLRIELFPAGLSDRAQTVRFASGEKDCGFIIDLDAENQGTSFQVQLSHSAEDVKSECSIQAVALDDVVKNTEIGFIKMDIEGAELSALQGARDVIIRDRPLLAISVYHRRGDVLTIMDYLHEVVPEYRFWLRHYDIMPYETVLYASI